MALAIGPLVGGVLVEVDWRVIFWINLPVAALGIAITALAAPESTDPGAGRRIDLAGLVALSVGLTAVVLALVQARVWSAAAIAALAVARAGRAVRLLADRAPRRRADRRLRPLPQRALLRRQRRRLRPRRLLLGGDVLPAAVPAGRARPLGILSGLLILPVTVPMVFISPFSGRLIGRFGARRLMTAGMAFGIVGLLVLTRIGADSSYGLLLAGYLLFGIALGLVYAPMSTAAMAAMPRREGRHRLRRAGDGPGDGRRRSPWPRPAPSSTPCSSGGSSFAAAIAGSTWVLVALCAVGPALTWAFVRDPSVRARPGVAGKPRRALQHHRTTAASTSERDLRRVI